MARFVKSVEKITINFNLTTGALDTVTVNLSKNQDHTQCVPFITARYNTIGDDYRDNDFCSVEMIDNAGTPAARGRRHPEPVTGTLIAEVFVVEFESSVTIQQGSTTLTSTLITQSITAVDRTHSFLTFSQHSTGATLGTDDFGDSLIEGLFDSDTNLIFIRNLGGAPDWEIYWYVVESNGVDFEVEFIRNTLASTTTELTDTLANTVALDSAFLVGSYRTSESSDDMRDGIMNYALISTTQVRIYRDHGGSPSASCISSIFVVRCSNNEFDVQRAAIDLGASLTNDTDINAINQDKSIIVNSNYPGGAWSCDDTSIGLDVMQRKNSLVFLDNDTVRAEQHNAEASGGTGKFRFEVIEFDIFLPPAQAYSLNFLTPDINSPFVIPPVKAYTLDGQIPAAGPDIIPPAFAYTLNALPPQILFAIQIFAPMLGYDFDPKVPFVAAYDFSSEPPFGLNLTPVFDDVEDQRLRGYLIENFSSLDALIKTGKSGFFISADGKTVFVHNGLIVDIV